MRGKTESRCNSSAYEFALAANSLKMCDGRIDFAYLLCYTFLVTINMRRDMESG